MKTKEIKIGDEYEVYVPRRVKVIQVGLSRKTARGVVRDLVLCEDNTGRQFKIPCGLIKPIYRQEEGNE